METHIEGTMYGDSYTGYNIWSLIWIVQGMETHIDFTMYGDTHREYSEWRLI